jgi:prepilin-type N-terminal cleavage/methylation domain-containing protein
MKTHSPAQKGFSLAELMVVISVLGVLLAIAIPSMTGYMRSARVMGTSASLESDLKRGVALATSQRKNYQIRFASGSYSMVVVSPLSTVFTRTLPTGVTLTASDTATFYAWGLAKPVNVVIAAPSDTSRVHLVANGGVYHD